MEQSEWSRVDWGCHITRNLSRNLFNKQRVFVQCIYSQCIGFFYILRAIARIVFAVIVRWWLLLRVLGSYIIIQCSSFFASTTYALSICFIFWFLMSRGRTLFGGIYSICKYYIETRKARASERIGISICWGGLCLLDAGVIRANHLVSLNDISKWRLAIFVCF